MYRLDNNTRHDSPHSCDETTFRSHHIGSVNRKNTAWFHQITVTQHRDLEQTSFPVHKLLKKKKENTHIGLHFEVKKLSCPYVLCNSCSMLLDFFFPTIGLLFFNNGENRCCTHGEIRHKHCLIRNQPSQCGDS